MDLQHFITETLKQVVQGVKEAQKGVAENGARVNPNGMLGGAKHQKYDPTTGADIERVEFDVAVTVTEQAGKAGKAGLSVWSVGVGGEAHSDKSSSIANRVRFGVNLLLPVGK